MAVLTHVIGLASFVQVLCLEVERLNQEGILSTFRDSLQSQQSNNSDLRDRLIQLERVEASVHEYAMHAAICKKCCHLFFSDNSTKFYPT